MVDEVKKIGQGRSLDDPTCSKSNSGRASKQMLTKRKLISMRGQRVKFPSV